MHYREELVADCSCEMKSSQKENLRIKLPLTYVMNNTEKTQCIMDTYIKPKLAN